MSRIVPLDRGATGDGPNVLPSIHVPGIYEAVLKRVVAEAIEDPYAALREESAEFYTTQASLVAAEIELRRGQPVSCQQFQLQLPGGIYSHFVNLPRDWQHGFTVSPDDTVTLRPRPPGV